MATYLFLSLLSFVKFTGPANVEKKEWERQNQALKVKLAPLHQEIARAQINQSEYIETLGNSLTSEICQFFFLNSAFFEDEAPNSSSNKLSLTKTAQSLSWKY